MSFQNYNDREEVLRRSKLIRGLSTPGASGRGVKPMGCHSEPHLYITEDTSRRVREHRSELIKFSREVHRRFPRWLNLRKFFTFVLGSSSIDLLMCRNWNFEYYSRLQNKHRVCLLIFGPFSRGYVPYSFSKYSLLDGMGNVYFKAYA